MTIKSRPIPAFCLPGKDRKQGLLPASRSRPTDEAPQTPKAFRRNYSAKPSFLLSVTVAIVKQNRGYC